MKKGYIVGAVGFVLLALASMASSSNTDSVSTSAMQCTAAVHKSTTVGAAAVNLPSTQLFNRRFVTYCNSVENAAAPTVKIRIDGVAPVMGLGNPGDVLSVGSCVTYNINSNHTAQAIASAAGTGVTSLECGQ